MTQKSKLQPKPELTLCGPLKWEVGTRWLLILFQQQKKKKVIILKCSQLYMRIVCFNIQVLKYLEKAMAPHSSTFAWKIPWTEEPGRLQSMRSSESDTTERLHFHALEKEMATHSSVLAWRIPGMGEPGGLPSLRSQSRTWLKWLSSSSSTQILGDNWWYTNKSFYSTKLGLFTNTKHFWFYTLWIRGATLY